MEPAKRLVQVMKNVSASGNQYVYATVLYEVGDETSHAGGNQRAAQAHNHDGVLLQHLEPDLMGEREIAPLKRDVLHLVEQPRHAPVAVDLERMGRFG